jgi:hypothetical protein
MKLIAHRGLMNGFDSINENTTKQIELALKEGFDAEVDVWWHNGKWWLGHDLPREQVSFSFLKTKGLWIHCKNELALETLSEAKKKLHYFWHQTDNYTLTSKGIPWVYPGKRQMRTGVCVLPEEFMEIEDVGSLDVYGICSDNIWDIRETLNG